VKFLNVRITNFISFGAAQEISLDQRGLVAVFGENFDSQGADANGAGKSAVLEAIVWALYGETMRGYRGDEVVNRVVGKDCAVALRLQDDEREYLIVRTRKTLGAKKPNDVRLFSVCDRGELEISGGTNADTQEQIQTIVGMDFSTFTQSVMLHAGAVSFSAMTDKEQKQVLENILQTEMLSAAQAKTKERIIRLQQEMVGLRSNQQQVTQQSRDLAIQISKLTEQRDQHSALVEERRKELVRRRLEQEVRLEEVYAHTGLHVLLTQREDQAESVAQLEQTLATLQERVVAITQQSGAKLTELAREEGIVIGRLRQISTDLQTIDQFVGKPCPTCKQTLLPDAAEAGMKQWAEEAQVLEDKVKDFARIRGRVRAAETKQLAAFANERAAVVQRLTELRGVLQGTSEAIQKRDTELKTVCDLEQQILSFDEEIAALSGAVNPFQPLIDEAALQLEKHHRTLRNLEFRIHIVETHLKHLNYWTQAFSNQGLKSYVLDGVLPFLTSRAQYYADILSGGDIKIQFNTQTQLKTGATREQFQVSAYNRFGADVYQGNSDGEKRRVDLAVGWALGDLAAQRARKPIRFKGLDEPFVNLDETGEDAVVRLLHKEIDRYETILCITHSGHLQSQFQNQLTIRKQNGVSVVV